MKQGAKGATGGVGAAEVDVEGAGDAVGAEGVGDAWEGGVRGA